MANTDPRTADEILRELYNNDDATSIDEIFRQVYGSGSNNTIMCGPNCKYTTVQAAVDAAAAAYAATGVTQCVKCIGTFDLGTEPLICADNVDIIGDGYTTLTSAAGYTVKLASDMEMYHVRVINTKSDGQSIAVYYPDEVTSISNTIIRNCYLSAANWCVAWGQAATDCMILDCDLVAPNPIFVSGTNMSLIGNKMKYDGPQPSTCCAPIDASTAISGWIIRNNIARMVFDTTNNGDPYWIDLGGFGHIVTDNNFEMIVDACDSAIDTRLLRTMDCITSPGANAQNIFARNYMRMVFTNATLADVVGVIGESPNMNPYGEFCKLVFLENLFEFVSDTEPDPLLRFDFNGLVTPVPITVYPNGLAGTESLSSVGDNITVSYIAPIAT
jgi:hypothetical protein